jgi:hypothetical protein
MMKLTEHRFYVRTSITLSREELVICIAASHGHYDRLCRAASEFASDKPGTKNGFLTIAKMGMENQPGDTAELDILDMQQLGTLCKLLEPYRGDEPQEQKDLYRQARELIESANAAYTLAMSTRVKPT